MRVRCTALRIYGIFGRFVRASQPDGRFGFVETRRDNILPKPGDCPVYDKKTIGSDRYGDAARSKGKT